MSKIIYEKGCIQAGEELVEENLIFISTMFILCIFFQVIFQLFLSSRIIIVFNSNFYPLLSDLDPRNMLCSKLATRHYRPEGEMEMTAIDSGERRLRRLTVDHLKAATRSIILSVTFLIS